MNLQVEFMDASRVYINWVWEPRWMFRRPLMLRQYLYAIYVVFKSQWSNRSTFSNGVIYYPVPMPCLLYFDLLFLESVGNRECLVLHLLWLLCNLYNFCLLLSIHSLNFDSFYHVCSTFRLKLSLKRKLRPRLTTESSDILSIDGAEYQNNSWQGTAPVFIPIFCFLIYAFWIMIKHWVLVHYENIQIVMILPYFNNQLVLFRVSSLYWKVPVICFNPGERFLFNSAVTSPLQLPIWLWCTLKLQIGS